MKKRYIIGAISIVIVSGVASAMIIGMNKPVEKKPVNQAQITRQEGKNDYKTEVATVTSEPVIQEVQAANNLPMETTEVPVAQIKSNDEYISEYFGTTNGALLKAVRMIVGLFPERFTDDKREASFNHVRRYFSMPANSNPTLSVERFYWW